jgi:hypothetical protein
MDPLFSQQPKDNYRSSVPSHSSPSFAPTAQDIHLVHKLLRCFSLPLEIVVWILDFAEYWIKENHVKYNHFKLTSGQSALFFQTKPIGCEGEHLRPIKVEFQIWSSILYNCHNVTMGSSNVLNSWFEASIFRQDETWQSAKRETPLRTIISSAPISHQAYPDNDSVAIYSEHDIYSIPYWLRRDASKLVGGYQMVGDVDDPFWFITSSEVCLPGRMYSCQTVRWRKQDILPLTEANVTSVSSATKNRFVSLLQTGDIIGLWARMQPDKVSGQQLYQSIILISVDILQP